MTDNQQVEKDGRVQINIIDDKMKVTARINPPTNEQDPPLVLKDVLELLDKAGIKFCLQPKPCYQLCSIFIHPTDVKLVFVLCCGINTEQQENKNRYLQSEFSHVAFRRDIHR